MNWYAFTLVLDDGQELPWQAMGKTATQALQELVNCWLLRMGDAAYFLGHEIAAIECLGPLIGEDLEEPALAHVAVTVPSSAGSQDSDPGGTSKMRRVVSHEKE